jgi:RNA polymerase sigma-70 factor (ECF subfamily)
MDSQRTQDEFPESMTFVAPTSTDEVLVAAAKLGDHPAFLEFWARHSSRVFKASYRITGNRDDAENAIQDAWMNAYLHLNAFDGRAQFTTWLTRIAVNSSLTILRRKRIRPETFMDIGDGDTWQH